MSAHSEPRPDSRSTNEHESLAKRQKVSDAKEDEVSKDEDQNKKESSSKTKKYQLLKTITLRKPQYTYFHLVLYVIRSPGTKKDTPSKIEQTMDILTFRQNLSSALSQFLGLTGTAIQIDILKFVDSSPSSKDNDSLMNSSSNQPTPLIPPQDMEQSHALERRSSSATPSTSTSKCNVEAYIRVPQSDAWAIHEALSNWTGRGMGTGGASGEEKWKWVVQGRDEWLSRVGLSDGMDLFGG